MPVQLQVVCSLLGMLQVLLLLHKLLLLVVAAVVAGPGVVGVKGRGVAGEVEQHLQVVLQQVLLLHLARLCMSPSHRGRRSKAELAFVGLVRWYYCIAHVAAVSELHCAGGASERLRLCRRQGQC
jgi:hypothetical protein